MTQGTHRRKQQEQRRKYFSQQAARGGAPPQAAPPPGTVTVGARGTVVGVPPPVAPAMQGNIVATPPPAQIQPHQVRTVTGIGPGPDMRTPHYAPQSGQIVPVTLGPRSGTAPSPRLPSSSVPTQPQADVTVILYSSGGSAQMTRLQLAALRRQTVQAAAIHVHVDGPQGHDETSLVRLGTTRTMQFGRHFRLAIARQVSTSYVAILEEDALPGARWLERALEAMQAADREDLAFGPAVIACSGVLQGSDDPADGHVIGPEMPRGDAPMEVDYGRHGWLFATEFARVAEGLARVGDSSDSLGLLLAYAAQQAGIPTVVMDYAVDQEHWGSSQPKQYGVDPQDATETFVAYLGMGWQPSYLGAGMARAVASPLGAPAPAAPPPMPQTQPQVHIPSTRREPVVRHHGGYTTIERVLEPHEQTPDPRPGQIVPPSPPPASALTEQIVPPSPPPASAMTEHIVASEKPKSQTGL